MQERMTSLGWQLLRVWESALQRRSLVFFFSAMLIAMLTVILVPDRMPSAGEWVRLFLVLVLTGLSLALLTKRMVDDPVTRMDRQLVGAVMLLPALLISVVGNAVAAFVLLVWVLLLVYSPIRARRSTPWWSVVLRLAWMVPIWAILMIDEWSAGLLMLIPVSLLAMMTDGVMRFAARHDRHGASSISARALRLLGWLSLLSAAVLLLVSAIFIDVAPAWILVGAASVTVLSVVDVVLPIRYSPRYVSGMRVAVLLERGAFVVLAVSWLGALPA